MFGSELFAVLQGIINNIQHVQLQSQRQTTLYSVAVFYRPCKVESAADKDIALGHHPTSPHIRSVDHPITQRYLGGVFSTLVCLGYWFIIGMGMRK